MELSVASGAVDGDKSGEDAHQEEDQHHVLREPNVLGVGGVVMVKGRRSRRKTTKMMWGCRRDDHGTCW